MEDTPANIRSHSGWLDHLAVGLATVCAVHCLLSPILIMILPIMATSFFVHENFHLWMILLVLPTTGFSIFMGCRQHKDRRVATMSGIGLSILIGVLIYERARHAIHADAADQVLHCASCVRDISQNPVSMDAVGWINTIAGFVLAGAHIRNYRLCRKNRHCCEQ